jgi:hypothetical protein
LARIIIFRIENQNPGFASGIVRVRRDELLQARIDQTGRFARACAADRNDMPAHIIRG